MLHEGGGDSGALLLQIKRHNKTGICVSLQYIPRLSSSTAPRTWSETTLSPNTFCNRPAKSGIRARAAFGACAGTNRATVRRCLVMATSSPLSTQARTRLKSFRTSRIDAVFMCNIMCHNRSFVEILIETHRRRRIPKLLVDRAAPSPPPRVCNWTAAGAQPRRGVHTHQRRTLTRARVLRVA